MPRRCLRAALAFCMALAATAVVSAAASPAQAATGGGNNDFACRPSAAHPDPVVTLHGTFGTEDLDLNFLRADLAARGYCAFSLTYGTVPQYGGFGGVQPIAVSAVQIKNFVERVRSATGAAKVDIVGHSEGAFQSLYVTKMEGISSHIGKVVAIAPPTHGGSASGFVTLADAVVGRSTLDAISNIIGVPVLQDELPGGPAIVALNNGPIAQPGVRYTIIASRYDELVTPVGTSSFVDEPGVTNEFVQDSCPFDPVGHLGEATDLNVWHLVRNALDPANATPIKVCAVGSPG